MDERKELDNIYRQIIKDLGQWLPEGISELDLFHLEELGLLHFNENEAAPWGMGKYFHVYENEDKVTLYNQTFVVWIIPERYLGRPITYTLIGLRTAEGVKMELAFAAMGIYNSSKIILRCLEKHLEEIQENHDMLSKIASI